MRRHESVLGFLTTMRFQHPKDYCRNATVPIDHGDVFPSCNGVSTMYPLRI